MATTIPSAALVPTKPVFTQAERLALAGFLAGYSGLTREAYQLDLRQYTSWCQQHHLQLFHGRHADIECFARDLEARGRARATITRRLSTAAGFYRYAVAGPQRRGLGGDRSGSRQYPRLGCGPGPRLMRTARMGRICGRPVRSWPSGGLRSADRRSVTGRRWVAGTGAFRCRMITRRGRG